jgi:hypothetical protein
MYHAPDPVLDDLYVITPIFNPVRYKSRYKHYHRFAKMVKDAGGKLVTIEAAFGEREFALRSEDDKIIRVRTPHELWAKENMINLAVQHLPQDWRYVAWIDADVLFLRPNWVGETIQQLQHYAFLQLFSRVVDLGPNYDITGKARIGWVAGGGIEDPTQGGAYGSNLRGLSTGLAWAARRAEFDAVGGLMDFCVLGSADWHMAYALAGRAERSVPEGMSSEYKRLIADWQDRAERYVRRNVGHVSGLLGHYWHGKKANRRYAERWQGLIEYGFAPSIDLKRDWQGLWQLTDRSPEFRDYVRQYFRLRNEDSIDTE